MSDKTNEKKSSQSIPSVDLKNMIGQVVKSSSFTNDGKPWICNFKIERSNLSFESCLKESFESSNRTSDGTEDASSFRPKTALPRLEQSTVLKTPFLSGKGKSDNSLMVGKKNIYSLEKVGNFEMLEKPKVDGKQRREVLRQRAAEEKETTRKKNVLAN